MRQQPRWREFQYGTREPGLIAAVHLGSGAYEDTSRSGTLARPRLDSFNLEVFRGDLQSLPGPPPAGPGTPHGAQVPEPIRWEVDTSCPGRETLERFLNRDPRSPGGADSEHLWRLVYIDAPIAPLGSGVEPLFTVRCPVLFDPSVRRVVSAMGASTIVAMHGCQAGVPERSR